MSAKDKTNIRFNGREYAPRLRGLARDYFVSQMRGFKARTRGDLDGAMTPSW